MNRSFTQLVVVAIALGCVAEANAEGWQMPNLNPFAESKPAKASPYRIKNEPSKSWLPSLPKPSLPSVNGSKIMQRAQSAPGKLVRSTKNAVNYVNPFKGSPQPPPPPTTQYSNETKKKKSAPSWFSPWGDSSESQGQPQTVSDFIAGPRPE